MACTKHNGMCKIKKIQWLICYGYQIKNKCFLASECLLSGLSYSLVWAHWANNNPINAVLYSIT